MHILLDELSLLIQYAHKYSKYIKSLCVGAQKRQRPNAITIDSDINGVNINPAEVAAAESGTKAAFQIFPGPVDFDRMIGRYSPPILPCP